MNPTPSLGRTAVASAMLMAVTAATVARAEDSIADYLVSPSAGPVSASDILGLSGTVSNLQTPRDLALALGSFGNRDTTGGFGISFTPGRSSFGGLGVKASEYVKEGATLTRLWGGTSFSYAQNKKTIGGKDHEQTAFAVSVNVHLKRADDPIVVAWDALEGADSGPCKDKLKALDAAEETVQAFILRRVKEETERLKRPPNSEERERIIAEAPADMESEAKKRLAALRTCAHEAATAATKKWNSSRLQLALGEARIKQADGGSRLKLGRYAKASLALRAGENGLVNLTLLHAGHELDTSTIGKTHVFKTTQRAALRYTYKASKPADLLGIAEINTIKTSSDTLSNDAFRYAVGIDHKVTDGLWFELRLGRARTVDGGKLENKALFALKFSPESTLEGQAKKAK